MLRPSLLTALSRKLKLCLKRNKKAFRTISVILKQTSTMADTNPALTPISALGEFGLIHHLTQNIRLNNAGTLLGTGDDAAIVQASEGVQSLISTDLLVEGVHFDISYTPQPTSVTKRECKCERYGRNERCSQTNHRWVGHLEQVYSRTMEELY